MNSVLRSNDLQQLADRLVTSLAGWTTAWDGLNALYVLSDSFDSVIWDPSPSARAVNQQAANETILPERSAVLDKVFADLANDGDDFGDLGEY